MTIGIGAHGPNAGLAVFRALHAAEAVGRGSIGGFACFAAIGSDGRLYRQQTQRGGSNTLFIEGENTGIAPPAAIAAATRAALISSGPERPEPLEQFLAADPASGLVTGHRLPNTPDQHGQALNQRVLEQLRSGVDCQTAIHRVLDEYPQADAGFIAVDLHGGVAQGNSPRVQRRPDLGSAERSDHDRQICVQVLHNAIRPYPILAELVAQIAFETMLGDPPVDGWIEVSCGIPVVHGEEHAVHCGKNAQAHRVVTTDRQLLQGKQVGAAIYLHSAVYQEGIYLGRTQFEPNVTLMDGVIQIMSGQQKLRIAYCR